jgi:hypothetical protein
MSPVLRRVANPMKGIIFNLLEDVVIHDHGQDTWDELLTATSLDGAYTSLGSYPDEHIQLLVGAAARMLGVSPFEVLRWFGQRAIPLLVERYPSFFTAQHPGADVPTFEFHDAPGGALMMGYRSPRKLCALAQGFTEGAATHYGETVIFEHRECMHNGDARCLCHISFSSDRSD